MPINLLTSKGFGNTVYSGDVPHVLRRGFDQALVQPTGEMSFQFPGLPIVFFERGRTFPIVEPISPYQRHFEDESLKSKVISYGAQSGMIRFDLEGISKNNKDEIEAFFDNAIMMFSNQLFFFTNEDMKIFEVFLWQDSLVSRETSPNRFNISMVLKNMGELI